MLKFLSATEAQGVKNVELNARLSDGDEYVDLENLARGVRTAKGVHVRTASVLPKKLLEQRTWLKIVHLLSEQSGAPAVE